MFKSNESFGLITAFSVLITMRISVQKKLKNVTRYEQQYSHTRNVYARFQNAL